MWDGEMGCQGKGEMGRVEIAPRKSVVGKRIKSGDVSRDVQESLYFFSPRKAKVC